MDRNLIKALEIGLGIITLVAGMGYLFQLGSRMDEVMKASLDYHNTDMHYTSLRAGAGLNGTGGTGGIYGSYIFSGVDNTLGLDVVYHQLVEAQDVTVWIDGGVVDTLEQWLLKNEGAGVHEGIAVIKGYLDGLGMDQFLVTLVVDGDEHVIGMRYESVP